MSAPMIIKYYGISIYESGFNVSQTFLRGFLELYGVSVDTLPDIEDPSYDREMLELVTENLPITEGYMASGDDRPVYLGIAIDASDVYEAETLLEWMNEPLSNEKLGRAIHEFFALVGIRSPEQDKAFEELLKREGIQPRIHFVTVDS